jgi:hypothetical protein
MAKAELGSDLPATLSEPHEELYETVESLVWASELIVVGEVVSVESIGTPDWRDDPSASEYFIVGVRPNRTLKGTSPNAITIGWEAFVTDGKGTAQCALSRMGSRFPIRTTPPFLVGERPERNTFLGGGASHALHTLTASCMSTETACLPHLCMDVIGRLTAWQVLASMTCTD